jgi:hypothetical protein
VQTPHGPADRVGGRIARDAEAGKPAGRDRLAMEGLRRLPGHVEEPAVVDPQPFQEPVDPPGAEPGEVGQRRAQVRRADRGQAQHADRPRRVAQQEAGVEPPHAMREDVDRLVGEGRDDLLAEPPRAEVDPGDRVDPRHQDPVAGGAEPLGDLSEIRSQRQPAQADPAEPEQAVRQHDRSLEPGTHRGRCSRGPRPVPPRHRETRPDPDLGRFLAALAFCRIIPHGLPIPPEIGAPAPDGPSPCRAVSSGPRWAISRRSNSACT